jgi:methionine-rich copper-binding protein CopC
MSAGSFKVRWRALSADGHVIKGDFDFTVGE